MFYLELKYNRNFFLQTEIRGVRHPYGLAEGWKWLAMFLNTLPATTATACALHAFLKVKICFKTPIPSYACVLVAGLL
jgi:hypothetical protein